MRIVAHLATAAAAVAIMAAPALAGGTNEWEHLTAKQKDAIVTRQIASYRTTVRWWLSHRDTPAFRFSAHRPEFNPLPMCASIGIRAPAPVCVRGAQLVHALKLHERLQDQIQDAAAPAHAPLWRCLMRYEGGYPSNQNTGGNGHWGGLQMHPDWGHGTSHHASDDPWSVQMQAAERGYAESGYSHDYLTQQWGQTIGNCDEYAEH